MNIFKCSEHKAYTLECLKQHGITFRHLAGKINVDPSRVSQVLTGGDNWSDEQAIDVSQLLGLQDLEAEYYVELSRLARIDKLSSKNVVRLRLDKIKKEALKVGSVLPGHKKIDQADSALFYSHWIYNALRVLSSIPKYQNKKSFLSYFDIPIALKETCLKFLVEKGFILQGNRSYKRNPECIHTHIDNTNPLISNHYQMWHEKALERRYDISDNHELMFSSPLSISHEGAIKVRKAILKLISETRKTVDREEPEEIYCLNIDWVKIKK